MRNRSRGTGSGRRRLRLTALAAIVSLAGIAGCSSATKSSPAGSAGPGGDSQLKIAMTTDPVSLNPLKQRVTTTFSVLRNMYDPLVDFKSATDFGFQPILATSWKQISPTQLQLQLRKDVKFQDGTALDSASVVYTVQALLGQLPGSEKALAAYQSPTLTKATADGDYTVSLYTSQPTPQLLSNLTQLLIIPKGSMDSGSTLATAPDGTGPYKFVSYTPGQNIVMTAKADYFLGAAAIQKLTWQTIPTATSQLAALQAGTVDLVYGILPSQVKGVEANAKNKVMSEPSTRVAAIWLDTLDNKYLKDPKVRQALNYAVDRESIVSATLQGFGEALATIVPESFEGHDPSLKPYPYDPDRAKKLLAEAGYPDGFPLTIMVPTGRYILGPEIVQVIASELNAVGVKTTIQQVAFSDFATLTAQRKIPGAFFGALSSNFPDPMSNFQTMVIGGTKGFSWFDDPDVNTLIKTAAVDTDKAKYDSNLIAIQQKIYTAAPFIFLFSYKNAWGMSKKLAWTPPSTEIEYMYTAKLTN